MTIISPISIDLGAKNTGIYLSHFNEGEDPANSSIEKSGHLIVIDGKKTTWTQQDRTAKRHQIRSKERRKMAKRLLNVILTDHFAAEGWRSNKVTYEFILGLLNNRGFTRLLEGLDERAVQHPAVAEYFVKNHPDFFNNADSFYSDFVTLSNDIEDIRQFHNHLNLTQKELKKQLEENGEEIAKAYGNIKNALAIQIQAEVEGHKHRRLYLENITQDIAENSDIQPLLKKIQLSANQFGNLLGHISNLQLRVLRKYFNDPKMRHGDYWDEQRLHGYFFDWIKSWHSNPDSIETKNKRHLLGLKPLSLIDIFTNQSAQLSIPPYEDQNNRRPTKDMTLRLNSEALEAELPDWENITKNLIENYRLPIDLSPSNCNYKIDIKENIADATHAHVNREQRQLATVLQRIMDRTKELDPYKLRLLSAILDRQGNLTAITDEARQALHLLDRHSQGQALSVVSLAQRYYAEVETIKQGLWSKKSSLFYRCDTNPPHKNKILHRLCGHILGESLDQDDLTRFIVDCWKKQKVGRCSLSALAKNAEALRKKHGYGFKQLIERQKWLNDQKKPVEDHEALSVFINCDKASVLMAKHFNHNEEQRQKYANPFSLAQLYNLLETDLNGFSKTDRWNTEENGWRGQINEYRVIDKQGRPVTKRIANAVRLPADSIRPFDGMLARILERQAKEIAEFKAQQILNAKLPIAKGETLFIPILMEQNRFKFEEDLADIKSNAKKRKGAKEAYIKQRQGWQDKQQRLREASHDVCPYTGKPIGDNGEIDHIIPRNESRKQQDVVYNSEANLIYCSGEGNKRKGKSRFYFDNLHPNYLKKVFPNQSKSQIKTAVENHVKSLNTDNFHYHLADEEQQKLIKHALFFPELDSFVFPLLNTRYKTLVNGTQGYLGKLIRSFLMKKLPDYPLQIKTYQIKAQEVAQLRQTLAATKPEFAKLEQQSAFSHVIDAGLVLAAALQNPEIAEELKTVESTELAEQGEWLADLLPAHCDILHVERKPKYKKDLASTQIFKEGLYGERFFPMILTGEKLYIGFALDNCYQPVKDGKKRSQDEQDWFDSLKPFLLFSKKELPPETGWADWQQRALNKKPFLYFEINKPKALALLQKVARQICNPEEIRQARYLEELRYTVEKKDIKSILLTGQNKKKFISALDDKKFRLAHGLVLPAKKDWQKLLNTPFESISGDLLTLNACLGMDEQVMTESDWQQLIKKFFHQAPNKNNNRHKTVRKDYSLPIVSNPSGGFRIERKSSTSATIYQVSSIEGYASLGFCIENGRVNFNRPAPIPALRKSARITPVGEQFQPVIEEIAAFDLWREIELNDETAQKVKQLRYAIGSKDRFYIQVTLDFAQFDRFINGALLEPAANATDLRAEIKVNDADRFQQSLGPLFGKPRSNLFVHRIGDEIRFWYIVESTNSAMKNAYQNGA